ncbi:sulfotransferase family protein [Roseitranquillus sediminis]|uniref:sulfotransferase family protein n=1 Tax=Roseitranquillus sediminis TaxID=2809051 RepID=UPI001D0CA644|nr:sulfotransferase domain-containing protein [Roseitranquillus sediminis]MBM9595171.1 sulfotransferase domain-containing protein [Roseitranquillus sediminis]
MPAVRARPDFLIVGAQKAGTTSLHSYLAQHPRLTPARGPKELHYFNLYYGRRGAAWYLSHFPWRVRHDGSLLFEATPDYLAHPEAPGRIRRDLGRVKLIAVLREPAGRAFSAWRMWHGFAEKKPDQAGKVDPRSFSQAIDEELASPDGQAEKHFHYVAMGRYADHLATWRRHFDAADMLVLDYGLMSRDLQGFLDRICDFLEVARFSAADVERLGGERLWVSPAAPETDEVRVTLDRLRAYYAPSNARLFEMLGERWDWPAAVPA